MNKFSHRKGDSEPLTLLPFASGKLRSFAFIALLGALTVSLSLNVQTYLDGRRLPRRTMTQATSQQGTIILTPQQLDALISDLTSGDKAALERWRAYFYTSAGYDPYYNEAVASSGLKETAALYATKEKPGRSNLFHRLIGDLRVESEKKPLTKQALLGFLGQPDATREAPDSEVLEYNYCLNGIQYFPWILVSNDMVLRIDIHAGRKTRESRFGPELPHPRIQQ